MTSLPKHGGEHPTAPLGRSHDEIVAVRDEWMAAVAGGATRFGQVSAYDGPSLPAPALPGTRLRPRGNR